MESNIDYDILIKIVLIGDHHLGKTSIIYRYVYDTFELSGPTATIGYDFLFKKIIIKDKIISLQIMDLTGGEVFWSLKINHYKGAYGVLFVFDITDRESFLDVENRIIDCHNFGNDYAIKVLVGSKCDLDYQRKVNFEEAVLFAKKHGIKYYETSAKEGINIDKVFFELSKNIIENFNSIKKYNIIKRKITLSKKEEKQKKKCF